MAFWGFDLERIGFARDGDLGFGIGIYDEFVWGLDNGMDGWD